MADNQQKNDEFDEIQNNEIEVLKSIFGVSEWNNLARSIKQKRVKHFLKFDTSIKIITIITLSCFSVLLLMTILLT
jgi:UbiD family decarboxylase